MDNTSISTTDIVEDKTPQGLLKAEFSEKDSALLQVIFGIDGYKPTILMVRALVAYVRSDGSMSVPQVIRDVVGGDYSAWYRWRADPKFTQWWSSCVDHALRDSMLSRVHLAMFRRACKDSAQDTKTYLERFDKEYKPSSALTLDTGFTPPSGRTDSADKRRQQAIDNRG